MQITKKYSLVRIALIVVELFQENNQFWRVFGSWLEFYSIRECTRELAPTFVLVNIQTKTTSDFNAMNLLRGKQASIWNLSKHPNQKQRAIFKFQGDEFIAGKAIETSKPKTRSDFNAMNLSRGSKHQSLETSKNQKQQANSTRANHYLN